MTNRTMWWTASNGVALLTSVVVAYACSSSDGTNAAPSTGNDSGAETGGHGGKLGTGGRSGTGGASGGTGGADSGATQCAVAVAVTCDGPEDCPSGQRCCGEWNGDYVSFGCFDSCVAQQGDAAAGPGGGPLWFDLCHPGDTCEDSTAQCTPSRYLPPSLSRCYNQGMGTPDPALGKGKGEINCGTAVCGAGEQCCIRMPLDPYCAAAGTSCDCAGPASSSDGGREASAPEAGPSPTDAALDATTLVDASRRD